MLSGRPGPVAVEMAWDTMASAGQVEVPVGAVIPPPRPAVAAGDRSRREDTADSQAPDDCYVGSGAQHASSADPGTG